MFEALPIHDLNFSSDREQEKRKILAAIDTWDEKLRPLDIDTGYDWRPKARPFKEWTRHLVSQKSKKNKKRLVVLPGQTGRDIQVLKHFNVSSPDCTWICAEQNQQVYDEFIEVASGKILSEEEQRKLIGFTDDVSKLNQARVGDPSRQPGPSEAVDFAWFDFVGNLTAEDFDFFHNYFYIGPSNSENLDLFFTFYSAPRGNIFFNSMYQSLTDRPMLSSLGVLDDFIAEFDKLQVTNVYPGHSCRPPHTMKDRSITRSCALDEMIVTQWNLLKYLFSTTPSKADPHSRGNRSAVREINYIFDCNCYIYHDDVSGGATGGLRTMILYHLRNFKPIDSYTDDLSPGGKTYFGASAIQSLSKLYQQYWYRRYSDETLAEKFPLLRVEDIKHWRDISGFPSYENIRSFQTSESFKNLLVDNELRDADALPDPNLYLEILKSRLIEFLDPISKLFPDLNQYIKVETNTEYDNYGLQITTPHIENFPQCSCCRNIYTGSFRAGPAECRADHYPLQSYYITIQMDRSSTEVRSFHDGLRINVIPEFLHELNKSSIFSVFRMLFRGDPYLHPQLIYKIRPQYFLLNGPQDSAIKNWFESITNSYVNAGAVVLPTGVGKTEVAFRIMKRYSIYADAPCIERDAENLYRLLPNSTRILFVCHQAEILDQTLIKLLQWAEQYSDDEYSRGHYVSSESSRRSYLKSGFSAFAKEIGIAYHPMLPEIIEKDGLELPRNRDSILHNLHKKIVFASRQTLVGDSRNPGFLSDLARDHFGLIIIDEAHHAGAGTYQSLTDHFSEYVYLLGLTATPFRMDAYNIMTELLDRNYLVRLQLNRAIWSGYLSFPEYHLIELTAGTRITRDEALQREDNRNQAKAHILGLFQEHLPNKKTIGFCNYIFPHRLCPRCFGRRVDRDDPRTESRATLIRLDFALLEHPIKERYRGNRRFRGHVNQIIDRGETHKWFICTPSFDRSSGRAEYENPCFGIFPQEGLWYKYAGFSAVEMSEYFGYHGIKCAVVHSDGAYFPLINGIEPGPSAENSWLGKSPNEDIITLRKRKEHRSKVKKRFENNEVQVLFVKSLFDEGVDIPDIEALLILRKSRSRIIQTQQLGRSLRLSPGKRKAIILDFFGDYRDLFETYHSEYVQPTPDEPEDDPRDSGTRELPDVDTYDISLGETEELPFRNIPEGVVEEIRTTLLDELKRRMVITSIYGRFLKMEDQLDTDPQILFWLNNNAMTEADYKNVLQQLSSDPDLQPEAVGIYPDAPEMNVIDNECYYFARLLYMIQFDLFSISGTTAQSQARAIIRRFTELSEEIGGANGSSLAGLISTFDEEWIRRNLSRIKNLFSGIQDGHLQY
jgi:superfamily II DNA or RNA helicase